MSDRPWFPWYPADFRAKTGLLNAAEKGAYRELLDEIYLTRKGLPDDDKKLAKVCFLSIKKWQNVRSSLEPFFVIQDGYWYHKTAHEIMTKQKIINQSFSERGKLGAAKRWNKVIHNSPAISPAINPEMARPMANKKSDIKAFVVDVTNLHGNEQNLNSKPFVKKANGKHLTPERRQIEISELQSAITECQQTGKSQLQADLQAKLDALMADQP